MIDEPIATDTPAPAASPSPVSPPVVEAAPIASPAPIAAEAPVVQSASSPAVSEPATAADPAPAAVAVDPAPAPTSLLSEAGKKPDAAPAEVKAEDKPAEAAKTEAPVAEAAPPEPIAYDFKLPETVKISETELKEVGELFNEARVPPETAQKYLDRHYAEVTKVADAIRAEQHTVWNKTQDDWRDRVMTDPELGGNRLQTTLNTAGAVIEQYGSDELRQMLGYTGAGNHPALVRFLHNIGKALGEGRPVPAPVPVPAAVRSRAERLYGNRPNGA